MQHFIPQTHLVVAAQVEQEQQELFRGYPRKRHVFGADSLHPMDGMYYSQQLPDGRYLHCLESDFFHKFQNV